MVSGNDSICLFAWAVLFCTTLNVPLQIFTVVFTRKEKREEAMSVNDPDFWTKEFPITSITRADVAASGLARTFVKSITDEQMQQIASRMEDSYCDGSYWTDLNTAATYVTSKEGGSPGE